MIFRLIKPDFPLILENWQDVIDDTLSPTEPTVQVIHYLFHNLIWTTVDIPFNVSNESVPESV